MLRPLMILAVLAAGTAQGDLGGECDDNTPGNGTWGGGADLECDWAEEDVHCGIYVEIRTALADATVCDDAT